MSKVFDLATGRELIFSCAPSDAVVCAYAQSVGDWNTWTYADKYNRMLEFGVGHVTCGDFTCRTYGIT